MEDFFKKNLMNCIPQEVDNHCSALTTVEMLQHITHNNKVCELNEFLTGKLHFECAVGYGIGANFDNAIRNSVNARKEAVQLEKVLSRMKRGYDRTPWFIRPKSDPESVCAESWKDCKAV